VRAFFAFFLAPPLGGAGLTRDVFFLGPRFRGDDNIGAGFRFAYLAENVLTEAILTVIVNFSFWLTDYRRNGWSKTQGAEKNSSWPSGDEHA